VGVCVGSAFKVLMKAVVMPLLGADPVNATYHYLAGNPAALPGMLFSVVIGAGFGEETLFRGYMFERLRKLLGPSVWAKTAIVLFTSAVFALAHYPDQGLAGVEQATFTGLAFGTVFAVTGEIWPLICAHAAFDVVALAIIYFDVEASVAHLVFR
jgi:membrane protease YdiL (CAAX protease family)